MASFVVYGDTSGQVTVAAPAAAGSNTITFPAETGTLVTSASTTMPNTIAWNTTVQTSSFTAAIDSGNFCNTTGGAFTVTLPAAPARGDFVVIVDYAGTAATNNITVSPNGGKINGDTQNQKIVTNRTGLTFTYIDTTQGWLATSNVYSGNPPFNPSTYSATYLVVAGGGSGGSSNSGGNGAGGGGAGGYITSSQTFIVGNVYTATVGGGGSNASGSDSVLSGTGITTVTSIGGGKGGNYNGGAGSSGGSGGGGAGAYPSAAGAGGSGTSGQGNSGQGGNASTYPSGGGGGGAGGQGTTPAFNSGGTGGPGTASSITGSSVTYAGGGGGSSWATSGAAGGDGGGGKGGSGSVAGTANTGGGGGGGNQSSNGRNGGSGIVILSVPTASYSGITTGSPTITTSGSNTILQFTGSGTYTA
jgi:hypothetical protein